MKSIMDGETTLFVGGHYEITDPGAGQTVTKYYMAGATRVAVRKGGTLSYMLADHLGSTSLVTDASGNRTSELRYKPWGETRFSFGTMPTKYTFTGQFSYTDDPSTEEVTEGFGLMYYNARWVDPQLGRFAQADTVIPDGPQGYDRYAYGNNNPLLYADPTGHDGIPFWLQTGLSALTSVAQNANELFASSLASVKVTKNGNAALSVGARNGVFTNTFGLKPGGNYNPSTITSAVTSKLAWSNFSAGNVGLTALVSFGSNLTSGEHEAFSQEFWSSVAVDTAVSALTSAAVAVGVGIALGALGVVASPLLITGLVVAGSMAVGYALEEAGVNDALEDGLNQAIDTVEEYVEEDEDE